MAEWILPSKIGGHRFMVVEPPAQKRRSRRQSSFGDDRIRPGINLAIVRSKLTKWTMIFAGVTTALTFTVVIWALYKVLL